MLATIAAAHEVVDGVDGTAFTLGALIDTLG